MGKILVTGVLSKVGLQLAIDLLEGDNDVIGVTLHVINGHDVDLKLREHPRFELLEGDVSNHLFLLDPAFHDVTEIYHLPFDSSYKNRIENMEMLFKNAGNTSGTKNLLKLAHRNQAKFTYVSGPGNDLTNTLLGNASQQSCNAEIFNMHDYEAEMRLGEIFCYEYYKRYNMDIKILRPDGKDNAILAIDSSKGEKMGVIEYN
ncbi:MULTISPECIES: NAD-dependent epimerase/dehydratase family protein [Bacillaceae]|uniref:NAD-dependent epimerase/dehydratase family protein n=1 Tax=Evansella alkalicola TaxID=745819 RepID=A0ABS6JV05_9BACI|nr:MULTISPECIES: NAD-dependent epimerase/dehydratase family protein [Bacillaceae]MBU9721529.1 NAD-dependent epimerase/dehydratase family protein [Bacillus alkalicola]